MKIAKITYPRVMPESYVITDQGVILDTVRCRPMAYSVDKDGYYRVDLICEDGKRRHFSVHRLVAWQFCEGYTAECNEVDHKNENKKFNFASNLEWVTSAENTRRAAQSGLRNIRGDFNGNSKYSEDYVRQICQRYVDGAMPVDLYNEVYPNQPLRTREQKSFYNFLYRLKQRIAWPDVIKDYDYSTETSRHDTSLKKFMPTMNSRYDENDVRKICEWLEEGYDVPTVTTMCVKQLEHFKDYTRDRMRDIVGSIYRKTLWTAISSEYDFTAAKYSKKAIEELAPIFKQLMDQEYDRKAIITIACKEFPQYDFRYISHRYTDYLKFRDIGSRPSVITLNE